MKIPTLLGLALIITSISLGILIVVLNNQTVKKQRPDFEPQNIHVVNISDTSATITWQTPTSLTGSVVYSENSNLDNFQYDNRNRGGIKLPHVVHFVTLKDLKPDTKYFYKIISLPENLSKQNSLYEKLLSKITVFNPEKNFSYPDYKLDFKTGPKITDKTDTPTELTRPIKGTVLNTNLNPIDEALVYLNIKDAQDLVSFTSTSGNFIIPLKGIRMFDLKNYYQLADNTPATLVIKKGSLSSKVEFTFPLENQTLPPITIGQTINLADYIASVSAKLKTQSNLTPSNKFDLNNDNKINTLDLSLVLQNFGKNPSLKRADLNEDGAVDQKDVDLLREVLK